MISAAKRKALEPSRFALPERRAYPIDTAARTRNAAARLEQNKGSLSGAEYRKARAAIARAAKRFGITSEYNAGSKKSDDGLTKVRRFPLPPVGTSPGPDGPGHRSAMAAPQRHLPNVTPGLGNPARPIEGPEGGDSIQGGFRVSVSSHPGGTRRVEVVHASDGASFGDNLPVELVNVFARLADAERRLKALPDGQARADLTAEVERLAAETASPRWNQIAKVGHFLGHPAGPFDLTPEVFDELVRNFREVDGSRVPIDFEHASEADESSGNIPVTGAPAQGWVTDLQNRGADGLWGLCGFLEPALSYIREGRYRSFSPAIRFGAKHPETGKPIGARLTSVALVTRPFLRGLQPLAARDAAPNTTGETTMTTKLDDKHPHETMGRIKACMGLHPLATADDMKAHLDKLRDHCAKIMSMPHGHAMGHVSAGGVDCGDYIAKMAAPDIVNASANMTTSDVLDAVEELIDAAMEIHEVTEHQMTDGGDTILLGQRLGKAEEKARSLAAEKTALMRDNDRLTLAIRAKDAEIAKLEAQVATSTQELVALRDAEARRVEEHVMARVTEAFETYRDQHKLSDAHRPMMVRELKADAANFEKLYPRIAPTQRHLLRDLTTYRTPGGATSSADPGARVPVTAPGATPTENGAVAPNLSFDAQRMLADRLVRDRRMTRESATSLAYEIAIGKKPMPQFTS